MVPVLDPWQFVHIHHVHDMILYCGRLRPIALHLRLGCFKICDTQTNGSTIFNFFDIISSLFQSQCAIHIILTILLSSIKRGRVIYNVLTKLFHKCFENIVDISHNYIIWGVIILSLRKYCLSYWQLMKLINRNVKIMHWLIYFRGGGLKKFSLKKNNKSLTSSSQVKGSWYTM